MILWTDEIHQLGNKIYIHNGKKDKPEKKKRDDNSFIEQ